MARCLCEQETDDSRVQKTRDQKANYVGTQRENTEGCTEDGPQYGFSHWPEYKARANMNQRVLNPNNPDYPRYGGTGTKIDPRWLMIADN